MGSYSAAGACGDDRPRRAPHDRRELRLSRQPARRGAGVELVVAREDREVVTPKPGHGVEAFPTCNRTTVHCFAAALILRANPSEAIEGHLSCATGTSVEGAGAARRRESAITPSIIVPSSLPKTVVIGAGVMGLSIAWRLAQCGCPVTVYDRGEAGRGASWAAAGMLDRK